MTTEEFKEEFPGVLQEKPIAEQLDDNIDRPERHSIGGSMNRPPRSIDPLSPRNIGHQLTEDIPLNDQEEFLIDVDCILTDIAKMLKNKNAKYGNSALDPIRIFSSADPVEQIRVRIDDKLSRISNQHDNDDEDVIQDLIGYLVLLTIANDKM